MKIKKPDYFDKFNCIASECEDTCCAGWGIVIDEETHKHYLSVEGEFGERLRSEIITEDGENIFTLKGEDCAFLNENKLCDIYSNLGGDSLCYTCRQYPRYLEEFGSLREIGISLSCPEAARIILRDSEKVKFNITENDEEVSSYNDINPTLYINLVQCRNIVFNFMQNRDLDINVRCALSLIFVDEIQKKIDSNDIKDIKEVKDKFLNEDFINKTIEEIKVYRNNGSKKYENLNGVLNVFKGLKHINPNDPLGLDDALRYFWQSEEDEELYLNIYKKFEEYYKDKEYHFEQILVYFVYRYFMKSVFDYDVLAKIKTAIISCIMIKELSVVRYLENKEFTEEDMVDIAHTYSKDVEHLEENIETLAEIFETNEVFNIEEFLILIMN
ncbi:flagellin lysine-N-methylase [Clostridium sp.]|uniref:flagellin lysine-N-methylase n=1 Tax=Clostridium sp. TaxID=1506 RepID=UPI003F2EA486